MSKFMREALSLAESALKEGEIPVGAVVVRNGEIAGRGSNRQIRDNDPTAHAEVVALRDAGRNEGNYRLDGAHLYVTVRPCAMCREAIRRARIERVYYASPEAKESSHKTGYAEMEEFSKDSVVLIREFFRKKR